MYCVLGVFTVNLEDRKVRPEMSFNDVLLIVRALDNEGTPDSLALAGRLAGWLGECLEARAGLGRVLAQVATADRSRATG